MSFEGAAVLSVVIFAALNSTPVTYRRGSPVRAGPAHAVPQVRQAPEHRRR